MVRIFQKNGFKRVKIKMICFSVSVRFENDCFQAGFFYTKKNLRKIMGAIKNRG